MTATVVRGDARSLPFADGAVDLIVTSPPYFGLRSYTDGGEHYAGQIGAEPTSAAYIDSLIECTREWVRALKPTGSLWINLGDKYSTYEAREPSNRTKPEDAIRVERSQERARYVRSAPEVYGVPYKSLMGLPWRYAIRCIDELGLILRAEVIWSKPNGLPESVTDRVRRSHETWFHFTASPRYFANVDTIRETYALATAARYASGYSQTSASSSGQTKNGVVRMDNGGPPAPNALGKLPGSVWTIATQPLKVPAELGVDHFAAFPMEWPRRLILGWSPPGICTDCGEGRRAVVMMEKIHGTARRVGSAAGRGSSDDNQRGMNAPGDTRPSSSVTITGEACGCSDTSAPTRPAIVVDPFGGTGTTALVADALGRDGYSIDMSADYCRLARWRVTDPGERARARFLPKPEPVAAGQMLMEF